MLDEHRSLMIAKKSFLNGRSDNALHYNEGKIYVLGGMSYQQGSDSKLRSLNYCEVYSVEEDLWTSMTPFTHNRQ